VLAGTGTRADVPATGDSQHRDADVDSPTRVERAVRIARFGCGLLLFVGVAVAIAHSWEDVRSTIEEMAPEDLIGAAALILAGLGLSVLTWRRALSELGSTLHVGAAARIYLLGQLGKYLPGSVWALAAQTELGKRVGVPRMRGLTASIVAIGINVVTGLALGLALIPEISDGGVWRTGTLAVLLALATAALSPPVLTRLVDAALRLLKRPPIERPMRWSGIGAATAWSIASWLSYGLSVWLLALAVGAPVGESLPLCLAGVPLAMTAGFLVIIAPSGIGVREAVIVAALAPVLPRPDALAVALVARLLFTAADLMAAAAVLPLRARLRRTA
jgi:uncharacterized membrane protein YbhN (UPF0104 family)